MYTPLYRRSDTNTVTILSQESNTLYCPYSAVVSSRVNIGVVITEIPFCRKEQIRNQNDARTCTENPLYLFHSFFMGVSYYPSRLKIFRETFHEIVQPLTVLTVLVLEHIVFELVACLYIVVPARKYVFKKTLQRLH